MSAHGFTLIEILCALLIIGVLALLAGTSIGSMTARADSLTCLSNLRQVGVAARTFVGENNGRLPSSSHHRASDGSSLSWTNTLAEYLGSDFIGRCPSQDAHPAKVTYGWNDLVTDTSGAGISVSLCRAPSSTILVAELAANQIAEHFHFRGAIRNGRLTFNQFRGMVAVELHGESANYLFVDGHVESLSPGEIQRRLTPVNSTLIHP
ncbi:MAG: hypothetical protein Fur0032_20110 [Terrimicrobiaceae bacterium]